MKRKKISPILIVAIIVVLSGIGLWSYKSGNINIKTKGSIVSTVVPTPSNSTITPKPSYAPVIVPDINTNLVTHKSKYFSLSYPSSWYKWNFGRGVDREDFQINTIPSEDVDSSSGFSVISVSVGTVSESTEKTPEEFKSTLKSASYKNIKITSIDGNPALIYEDESDNQPSYTKTIWTRKNDSLYEIRWIVLDSKSIKLRDSIKSLHSAMVDKIFSTFKFVE